MPLAYPALLAAPSSGPLTVFGAEFCTRRAPLPGFLRLSRSPLTVVNVPPHRRWRMMLRWSPRWHAGGAGSSAYVRSPCRGGVRVGAAHREWKWPMPRRSLFEAFAQAVARGSAI
jgi:hypothetical protein